jgi:hypothetical protein
MLRSPCLARTFTTNITIAQLGLNYYVFVYHDDPDRVV